MACILTLTIDISSSYTYVLRVEHQGAGVFAWEARYENKVAQLDLSFLQGFTA